MRNYHKCHCPSCPSCLIGELEQLRAKIAKLQKDKERLDWLQKEAHWLDTFLVSSQRGRDIRRAIDAVMTKEAK